MLRLTRPVKKIAVLRANSLGDFLFATPALRALSKGFPEAEITYLSRPWLRDFISGRYPYVHRVVAIPYYRKLNPPPPGRRCVEAEIEEFFARMQAERFDLAIQMHGGGKESNPFLLRLGARHTLGLTGMDAPPLEANLRYVFYQHEALRYVELVGQLGIPWDGIEMELPLLPSDVARLEQHGEYARLRDYAVLHPGASDPRRRWPLERFARVAEFIHERYGMAVVVGGSQEDQALAAGLQRLAKVPVLNSAGQLDLGAYAALLNRARLFVGNDTGPAHMSFALRVPSVVIYWAGNLINAGPPTREVFRPVLSWTIDCPVCGRRECSCPVSFVQEASLEEALGNVADLLDGLASRVKAGAGVHAVSRRGHQVHRHRR